MKFKKENNMKIRKTELVERLANENGITQAKGKEIVDYLLDEIKKELKDGNEIELNGFGKFTAIQKEARTARNPRTGEKTEVPAKKAVKFKAGKQFNEFIQ